MHPHPHSLNLLLSLSLIAMGATAFGTPREVESPWFSVDPATWSDNGEGWTSSTEQGTWNATSSTPSRLVPSAEPAAAYIELNASEEELIYTPQHSSSGDIVHTEAELFFVESNQLPDIPGENTSQGALSLLLDGEELTYVGLCQGQWVPLSNPSVVPATDTLVKVRITLDYTSESPRVSYAIAVDGTFYPLSNSQGEVSFATGVPAKTSVSQVGFSGNGKVGLFSGTNVYVEKPYDIYINLDGATSGGFLDDGMDYGGGSWERVMATSPEEALTLAAEQKFGPGSLIASDQGYGLSLISIYGMSGMGRVLSSEQDAWGWGDVYLYPMQWVKEEGVWKETSSSILSYQGKSRTFALTFQATSFDGEPILHTFESPDDQALYEALMETYNWAGWGSPIGPNIAVTNVTIQTAPAELEVGSTIDLEVEVLPLDALNRAVRWQSLNESVAQVSASGEVTGMGPGSTEIVATSIDGAIAASVVVTVQGQADTLSSGGVTLQKGENVIHFSSLDCALGQLTLEGAISGTIGSQGVFALCYTEELGGEEQKVNVMVSLVEEGKAIVQGIPTELPSFFAIGLDAALSVE